MVPYPFVFRIIEVTGQCIQVIIDTFKVFFKEKQTALEKCLIAVPSNGKHIDIFNFFLKTCLTIFKTGNANFSYCILTTKIFKVKGCAHKKSNKNLFENLGHVRN